ncbi:MAG: TrmH family RNA methyltransferase [Elusimicrobiota bacterium]
MTSGARFVLVRPRNPNNIGAAARAMANFGLSELVVVDPYAPVWEEVRSSIGGEDVLKNAKVSPLAEALAPCQLVLGTSDGRRALRRPVVPLPKLADYLKETLPGGGRLAILFGSEKTGLRNEDLEHCHAVLRIPTEPGAPSMNLGQAAAVIAYELSRPELSEKLRSPGRPLATAAQREDLVQKALRAMDRLGYMRGTPEAAKAERLRQALLRWRLIRQDAALLQALLKRVAAL